MWPDNETEVDLLGFKVHSDLVEELVTDTNLLPVTVGVFGDWGSGKSSVMRMLASSLLARERIACIHFNGWQFEGYDDAKSALIRSILLELGEHTKVSERVRKEIVGFLKRIDWLQLAKVGYQTLVAPVVAAQIASWSGLNALQSMGIQMVQPPAPKHSQSVHEDQQPASQSDFTNILKDNPLNEAFIGVRQLRDDFESLIDATELDSIVILIDDLDRCEPTRLLDTLEAIKLFLAVPHVAFVVGADERIVRYAIASRYQRISAEVESASGIEQTGLVTDYLEKLIQIPYHLPRLSQSELETYISLLFCQQRLEDDFECVHSAFLDSRTSDLTNSFGSADIAEVLNKNGVAMRSELSTELGWCRAASLWLTDVLKGNPRQTKRLLNALMLRKKLAEVAHLELDDSTLVKLMILEYIQPSRFRELYEWQTHQHGFPSELDKLESSVDQLAPEDSSLSGQYAQWLTPEMKRWLQMPPMLARCDLRNYFWITRDRLSGILSGAAAIPLHLRVLIKELVEAGDFLMAETVSHVRSLSTGEQSILFQEMENSVKRKPQGGLIRTWVELAETSPVAGAALLQCLGEVPVLSISGAVPVQLAAMIQKRSELRPSVVQLLRKWAQAGETQAGIAAVHALDDLNEAR